jgi:hypothetical protein
MGWKFWQKSDASGSISQPSSSIDWPTEAYASLRLLAALYARDVYPFTEWQATECPIEWDLESLFRRTVKAHQLHVWFSVYLLQRGEVEARMLRDAFPHVMDELFPNEGMRDRIHNLLEAQAYAVDYFMTLSEEERAAAMNSTALESTSQWHLAFYLLVFNPDSPFVEPDEVPDGQQHALAACLEKASSEAQYAFTPMLQAVNRFDAAKLPAWEWSQTMGAHERHLQRRFGNPLFPPARRVVTVSDVYSARILDAKDYEEASQALESIGQELADFQPTRDWNVTLSQKKTQLEGLLYRIAGMDRRGDDLKSKAEFLVGHAGGYMKDVLKHLDPAQVSQIEKAEARHAQFLAQNPCDWSWQVYRGDVIPDDEAIQALLCESAESITRIVRGTEQFDEFLARARAELISIVRNADAEGHQIPGLEEKLAIFGVRVKR